MSMTSDSADVLSTKAIREFQTAELRIRGSVSALHLWERHLTPEERDRLGGDVELAFRKRGTAGMWVALHGVTWQRAVVDVAHKIGFLCDSDHQWLLRETGELRTGDEAYEHAIVANGLVLNEDTHEVFWRGEQIDIDWSQEALWVFVWELARHAKAGRPIDSTTFGGRASHKVVAHRKSRLKQEACFPHELGELIQVAGLGTQKLMLPPEEIRIFERHIDGEVREWLP